MLSVAPRCYTTERVHPQGTTAKQNCSGGAIQETSKLVLQSLKSPRQVAY